METQMYSSYSGMQHIPHPQQHMSGHHQMMSQGVPNAVPTPGDPVIKLDTNTNNNDPYSKQCRLFVGNLNTLQLSRDEVFKVFSRYGRIIGLSIHKGYAFVQYTTPQSAKQAVNAEQGKVYANFPLDVNVVSDKEAKLAMKTQSEKIIQPQQLKRKSIHVTQGHNQHSSQQSNHYNNYGSGGGFSSFDYSQPQQPQQHVTIMQKPRQNQNVSSQSNRIVTQTPSAPKKLLSSGPTDYFVCGNCRNLFTTSTAFNVHKAEGCRLRFLCQCNEIPNMLICSTCGQSYSQAWTLLEHIQNDHSISLYKISNGATGSIIDENEVVQDEEVELIENNGSPVLEDANQVIVNNHIATSNAGVKAEKDEPPSS